MSTLTCHTEGCLNAGVPIEWDLTMRDENGDPILDADGNPLQMSATCGPCQEPITDISEAGGQE
jgi:hypothetical protein